MITKDNHIGIAITCMLLIILASYGHSQAKTCQAICGGAPTDFQCVDTACPTGYTACKDGNDGCKVTNNKPMCCCPSASGCVAAGGASASGSATASPGGAEASGFTKASCNCNCGTPTKKITSTALYKPGMVEKIVTDEQKTADGKCQEQCARTCGGFTTCDNQTEADCNTCCGNFCTNSYSGEAGTSSKPGETPADYCKISCKSTCKFKGTVNGITDIIYMIAGLLGALMIAIHGIRMVTSQDPHDRDAAKSSIIHVIIALIIIAMAAALVNMFIGMGGIDTSGTSSTSGVAPAPVGGAGTCTDSSKDTTFLCSSKTGCVGANTGTGNCWSDICKTTGGKSHMYTYRCDASGNCIDGGTDCPGACKADGTGCA
jgi:hypothetical protein